MGKIVTEVEYMGTSTVCLTGESRHRLQPFRELIENIINNILHDLTTRVSLHELVGSIYDNKNKYKRGKNANNGGIKVTFVSKGSTLWHC